MQFRFTFLLLKMNLTYPRHMLLDTDCIMLTNVIKAMLNLNLNSILFGPILQKERVYQTLKSNVHVLNHGLRLMFPCSF